jgi:uncharacterized protein YbjT (DUF2867 family)
MLENKPKIAVFGATGYVGLILVNRLVQYGCSVKLFVRNKRRLLHLKGYEHFEMCDIELIEDNIEQLSEELSVCDTLYYLIHSMSSNIKDFVCVDMAIALVVAKSAKKANVEHIIYLGGLGSGALSDHLNSRHKIARILGSTSVDLTEIRAGIIVGAGSASFEIIKTLGKKLLFIPRLSYNDGSCQPIDIDDAINYLMLAYHNEKYKNQILEVGSKRILTYNQMLIIYANIVLKKKLRVFYLPFMDFFIPKDRFAKLVAFFSSIPYALAVPLIKGVSSNAIIDKYPIENIDPKAPPCISYAESVKKATHKTEEGLVESFWAIPLNLQVLSKEKEKFLYIDKEEDRKDFLSEKRMRIVDDIDVENIFKECLRIGGPHGYWSPRWMWNARATADKMIGGTGLEAGRQNNSDSIRIGEQIDFWIVSDYLDEDDFKVFTLKARLKSPGVSWLQFALVKKTDQKWHLLLRAYFKPDGILGYLYWYTFWIPHKYIFAKMINTIVKNVQK